MEWELLNYRLPGQPSRLRVGLWRDLRRLGGLALQNAVVAVPAREPFLSGLVAAETRVHEDGGVCYRFRLTSLSDDQSSQLIESWNALRNQEYAEIVEECDKKFAREIEFEIFRGNLTGAEAEEIEADLDKIRRWIDRVKARDCFEAAGKERAEVAIARSEVLLEDFVERVYDAESTSGHSLAPPADISWGEARAAGPESAPRPTPIRRETRQPQPDPIDVEREEPA
jgi:hypothetical protein